MNTRERERQESNGSLPQDVELLLPWHAAGTLNRRDAARVEQALANDSDLAARYELVREELGEAIRLNESLGAPSARAMEALFAKIDAEPARKPKTSFNVVVRVTEFIASLSPRTLAYGAAAAVFAILLQAGILTGMMMKGEAGFELASAPTTISADGAFVRIRFNPQATAADITAFLDANKAVVVDGPAQTGFFRVRVAPKSLPQAELNEVVKKLAASPIVSFAVPVGQP